MSGFLLLNHVAYPVTLRIKKGNKSSHQNNNIKNVRYIKYIKYCIIRATKTL